MRLALDSPPSLAAPRGRVLGGAVLFLVSSALVGWAMHARESLAPDAVSGSPPGTEWLEDGEAHWRGWVELVPAIRTPRFAGGQDTTRIYARLPAGGLITQRDANDRRTLVVPPGAELDRVERWRVRGAGGRRVERVLDVRGTRFAVDGEELHAFRPMGDDDPRLFGARWPRTGAPPGRVVQSMSEAMRAGHGLVGTAPSRREASISRFSGLLSCEGCHAPNTRPRIDGAAAWPRRPTDSSGLYSILATLSDSAVVETYRPRDDNLDDPFVDYACAEGSRDCATRVATLRLREALSAGAPHALAVCQSRRTLAPHLSAEVRQSFRRELEACGAE